MTISAALKLAIGTMAICLFAAAGAQANLIPDTSGSGNNDLEADVVVAATSAVEPDGPVFAEDFAVVDSSAITSTSLIVTPVVFEAATTGLTISPAPITNALRDTPEPGTWILVVAGISAIGIGWRKRKA